MIKLDTIKDIKKTLKDTPGNSKIIWKLKYPIVDTAKISAINKAIWGFKEWSANHNVTFVYKC
jgi:hypothetical protein